jgi:hypothetical protein
MSRPVDAGGIVVQLLRKVAVRRQQKCQKREYSITTRCAALPTPMTHGALCRFSMSSLTAVATLLLYQFILGAAGGCERGKEGQQHLAAEQQYATNVTAVLSIATTAEGVKRMLPAVE